MTVISAGEATRLQAYLQKKFSNRDLTVRARERTTDSLEVLLAGEFIGVIYKDDEDEDVSYDFNMAILEIDLTGGQI